MVYDIWYVVMMNGIPVAYVVWYRIRMSEMWIKCLLHQRTTRPTALFVPLTSPVPGHIPDLTCTWISDRHRTHPRVSFLGHSRTSELVGTKHSDRRLPGGLTGYVCLDWPSNRWPPTAVRFRLCSQPRKVLRHFRMVCWALARWATTSLFKKLSAS